MSAANKCLISRSLEYGAANSRLGMGTQRRVLGRQFEAQIYSFKTSNREELRGWKHGIEFSKLSFHANE